jgi:indolepyruvate ferredoxin oxidoreductase
MIAAETARAPGKTGLAEAVARHLFKLMAIKDEYEVARLFSNGAFRKQVDATFEGDKLRYEFHMAPPLLSKRDKDGHLIKQSFGPWMMTAFGWLAKLRGLRGGALDMFGKTAERRMERQLLADYDKLLDEIAGALTPETHATALALATIPEKIRGFGHVKEKNVAEAKAEEARLLEKFRKAPKPTLQAAE